MNTIGPKLRKPPRSQLFSSVPRSCWRPGLLLGMMELCSERPLPEPHCPLSFEGALEWPRRQRGMDSLSF